jgi:acetamidase/formamidase
VLIGLGALGHRVARAKKTEAQYYIASTSQTVYRGHFPRNAPPALTVPDGAIVEIDTVSQRGVGGDGLDPVAYLTGLGISESEILPDVLDVYYNLAPERDRGSHVLTGPIYIEGAEPGDTLEARIVKIEPRVAWGINGQSSGGALPGYLNATTVKVVRTKGRVGMFRDDVEIPLKPFQGIMATAPADDFVSPLPSSVGFVSSRPPGPFGGNMDLNDLGEGTSLFLPVFQPGAQFFTGDPHEVQGNGEVSGSAIEQSNTVTIQFIVHKGGGLTGPRAETPTHYILMGIDVDHDEALKLAIRDTLDFLQAEKGLSAADAMSFASLAVDFNIAESVDFTQLVMGRIPKRFFLDDWKDVEFWRKPLHIRSEQLRQGLDGTP